MKRDAIRRLYLLSFGIGATIFGATQPQASPACGPHNTIVERLQGIYGEDRQAMGLATNNTIIEVYASPVTGSWTITVTRPGGPTCLMATGQAFTLETPTQTADDTDV